MRKLLGFLNLLDAEKRLSLTNLALIACVAKVIVAQNPSFVELGGLLLSLTNYAHKRSSNSSPQVIENTQLTELASKLEGFEAVKKQIETIQSKFTAVDLSLGIKRSI